MIERSSKDISEDIVTLLAPCGGCVKFSHTSLVTKILKLIGGLFQYVKNIFIKKYSLAKSS